MELSNDQRELQKDKCEEKISMATAEDSTPVNMMNAVHDMQHRKENYTQCDLQTRTPQWKMFKDTFSHIEI